MPGSRYDGHTLHSQLEQAEILTGVKPTMAPADRGYRGVQPPEGIRLLISHTRGLPPALKKLLKRRQAIEATHAALCGAGHNLRLIEAPAGASLGLDALIVLGPLGGARLGCRSERRRRAARGLFRAEGPTPDFHRAEVNMSQHESTWLLLYPPRRIPAAHRRQQESS
jgi:hypothetical protein